MNMTKQDSIKIWQEKDGRWQVDWIDDYGQGWTSCGGIGFTEERHALQWLKDCDDHGRGVITKTQK
jgi:hypothetical protein